MKAPMTGVVLAVAVVAIGCGSNCGVEKATEEAKTAVEEGRTSLEEGAEALGEGLDTARDSGVAAAGALSEAARTAADKVASEGAAAVEQAESLVAGGTRAAAQAAREGAGALGADRGAAGTSYEVTEGDTLGAIASRHYGHPSHYRLITEANPGIIADPDLIFPGQVLELPPNR